MTRFSRLMQLVACALLFAACAGPGARTHVATFHNWTGAQPLTYELVRTPAQVESLEHAAYEAMLEERLGRAGFSRAQPARYRVGLDYRVVQNETIGARPGPSVSLGASSAPASASAWVSACRSAVHRHRRRSSSRVRFD